MRQVILGITHIIVMCLEQTELIMYDDGIVLTIKIFGDEVRIIIVTDEEIPRQTDIRDSDHVLLDGMYHHYENGMHYYIYGERIMMQNKKQMNLLAGV